MLTGGRPTLAQFIIEERRRAPAATGDFDALITDIALACKAISQRVALGVLVDDEQTVRHRNVHGEEQQPLDIAANDLFLRAAESGGHLAGMVSEELELPYQIPAHLPRGKYLLLFDPLDGSSNIEVNVSVGSIFSVLRAPTPGAHAQLADFLQPGAAQVPGLVDGAELVRAVFASDIGVDNDVLTTRDNGYTWFEVAAIAPARDLALDEVR